MSRHKRIGHINVYNVVTISYGDSYPSLCAEFDVPIRDLHRANLPPASWVCSVGVNLTEMTLGLADDCMDMHENRTVNTKFEFETHSSNCFERKIVHPWMCK